MNIQAGYLAVSRNRRKREGNWRIQI